MRAAAVAVAVLLAGATLGGCKQDPMPPIAVARADSADQVLFGFVHFLTRNGVREGHVEADTAFFYEPTQVTVLRNMKLVFIDSAGNENATVTSKTGTYKWQTGDMIADSNVVLRTQDGRVLKSEQLVYDAAKKELSSKVFFTYDKGEDHLQGDGFVSDMKFEHIVVDGPKGQAGKEGFDLPGQKPDST